jgi:hypothetical protein
MFIKSSRRVLLVLLLCLFFDFSHAQVLTITSPTSSVVVPEGDEFASDELEDAWDFDDRRDIGWEEGMVESSISASSGVWRGNTAVGGAYVFPLFPGLKGTLFSEGGQSDPTLPKFGINHRIDASKYKWLSFKASFSSRTQIGVYWDADDTRPQYWPDVNSPRVTAFDGVTDHGIYFPNKDWFSYSFDLTDNSLFSSRVGAWTGRPYVIRFDPSLFTGAGSQYQFDWIRLSDPSSAPMQTVSWNTSGVPTDAVLFLCYDDDASGFDGTPFHQIINKNTTGQLTFPTASLPPGVYRFYIEMRNTSGSVYTGSKLSGAYSAPLEVRAKPVVQIASPSRTSGDEYSAGIGNPWDMNSSADLKNLDLSSYLQIFRQFFSQGFGNYPESQDGGSVFQAIAEAPLAGQTETDAQLHLAVSRGNPIDTNEYKYLTYRMAIDSSQYKDISDKVAKGWVARPVWWKGEAFPKIFDTSKAHIVYEGWHNYITDLSDSNTIESGTSWGTSRYIDNLRIDPMETSVPTWFFLDYVKLYAKNRASIGAYEIKYNLTTLNPAQIDFYYDSNKEGFDGVKIGTSAGKSSGSHNFIWDTSGLVSGAEYFVYLIVNDGLSIKKLYADASVTIGPKTARSRVKLDFDGDGKSDPGVFRASTSNYFINSSLKAQSQSYQFGSSSFAPIEGDFDGDGLADRAFVANISGNLFWYVVRSSDGLLYSRAWGVPTDKIVVGDYNGNGRDEIAIYREGAWFVLDEQDRGYALYWGVPGIDSPVSGDFDGDGKTDLAIQRGTDGVWWILYSGFLTGHAPDYYGTVQWGLPWVGDVPMGTDFSGDGRDDIVVWRPVDGTWYTRDIQTGAISIVQWGLPGDVPLLRVDRDGDRKFDQAVFRPGVAMWFYRTELGPQAVQYGLGNDRIPK